MNVEKAKLVMNYCIEKVGGIVRKHIQYVGFIILK